MPTDTQMLDWIFSRPGWQSRMNLLRRIWTKTPEYTPRQAIEAAMRAESKAKQGGEG